ncbi:ATP-binding protein [Actibacterium sp. D379-3]
MTGRAAPMIDCGGTPCQTAPGLHLCFPGEPMAVRRALGQVLGWLRDDGIGPGDCGNVEIVLAEVLNNITEHAYDGGETGPVKLSVAHHRGELCLQLQDQGRAIPAIVLPAQDATPICPEPQDLSEGGFGWFLIHALTRDLCYCRDGATNCLKLRLRLEDTARQG